MPHRGLFQVVKGKLASWHIFFFLQPVLQKLSNALVYYQFRQSSRKEWLFSYKRFISQVTWKITRMFERDILIQKLKTTQTQLTKGDQYPIFRIPWLWVLFSFRFHFKLSHEVMSPQQMNEDISHVRRLIKECDQLNYNRSFCFCL